MTTYRRYVVKIIHLDLTLREYWILKAGNTLFQLTRHIIG